MKNKIKLAFVLFFIFGILLLSTTVQAAGIEGTTIVLNAGHGGSYIGCANNSKGLVEKDVTLKIANYLKSQLSQYYKVNVILTHNGRNFPNNDAGDLAARAMVARNNNADLYVSLHINDTNDKSVNGANVFVTSRTELPKYKQGMTILGNKILNNLNKLGIRNNGVINNKLCNDREPKYQYYDGSQADYYGDIRHAMKGDTNDYGKDFRDGSGIPTVLIEHCYMNNSHDVQFLDSEEDLKKIAKADGDAIIDYLRLRLPKDVITTMSISKENVNLLEGKTTKVTVTLGPNTASNKAVKWTSSNEKIAKVDANGNITGISKGIAKIKATSIDNQNVSKVVNVNIEKEEIKINESVSSLLLGKNKTLDVTVSPNWIESKDVVWETSNKDVIEVTQNGKIIAKKEGTAIITAKLKNNPSITDKISIRVVSKEIEIESILLNSKTIDISKNQTTTLSATIKPSNTTQSKELIWTSSNTKVATVTQNGKVTAKSNGNATITVKTSNGKIAVCKIIVKDKKISNISYNTHVENLGWQGYFSNGKMAGTTGKSLRLEGIKIKLDSNEYAGNISYQTHIENIGWQDWKKNDVIAGTTGKSLRLEAIKIKLTGEIEKHYDIYYRVHSEVFGWLDWAKNGEPAGTEGYSYRLEGIEIILIKKGLQAPGKVEKTFIKNHINYSTHIENIGWQNSVKNGQNSGTTGKALRLEGIKINLEHQKYDGNIEYRTHIQNLGWENKYVKNGTMSGTSGKSLRLEAIQIRLTGTMAKKYDIYYRVHIENFGWMGWTKNGSSAGSTGYSLRLEAIQICLVEKGGKAPRRYIK